MDSYKTLDRNISDYTVSFAFGDIYLRKSPTQQQQTMVTISLLGTVGTGLQLKLHINAGFKAGFFDEKIAEALIHCIFYIRFPRVITIQRFSNRLWRNPG